MSSYRGNPILRAALLAQLPSLPPSAEKRNDGGRVSTLVGSRGQPLTFKETAALPPPGDTGEESISAQEEMQMACAWLLSLDEGDAAVALTVIRAMREGHTA